MSAAEQPRERPVSFQGDLGNLPDALAPLKALPNWVCWRWHWRVNRQGVGKWDKPPFQPKRPDSLARNNDPSTWGTYEEALAAFKAGRCDGIGFNLSGTGFGAFDIDKCRNKETGEIAEVAAGLVDRAASYTEMTVSGTGLRVIGYGAGPKLHRKQKVPDSTVEVESYRGAERYIVITGNPLPGAWPNLCDIDAELDAVVAELDAADNVIDFNARKQSDFKSNFLPQKLADLIDNGPPLHEDLSRAFHHVVCWLHDLGWNVVQIEGRIAGRPIVPERYRERLAGEISRCIGRARPKDDWTRAEQPKGERKAEAGKAPPIEIFWHGHNHSRAPRSWVVKNLVPETGCGLLSGQWGTAKTFAALDLSAAIMTATPFAGRDVLRKGGVLFVAAEGATEIPIRLQGVVDHKLALGGTDLEHLPFAWIEECPSLKEDFERLAAACLSAASTIKEQFDLPLSLIIVDTLNAAANFKDGNDAAEGQFIMNRLNELSRMTGAFVIAVDHFGKAVETGTRGTSAKEAAADMVLALLADRDISGNLSNTRMAVRKLRGGSTGSETSFNLKVVEIEDDETTCIIEWKAEAHAGPQATYQRDRWPRSTRILKSALLNMLIEDGKENRPFGMEGPLLKTVRAASVRTEFMKRYPADAGEADKQADTKSKAFRRALQIAVERSLIGSREIHGEDHLWLIGQD